MCFKDERTNEDPFYTEIQGQCEGKMIPYMLPTFSIDLAAQDLYTAFACHKGPHQPTSVSRNLPSNSDVIPFPQNEYLSLVFQGMVYDHKRRKTYKRNLEKENPIICHSVEEGEENKKTKLFFLFLCT